jgi:RNA polymerase sigma-70 factor (ECF subfamily)
MSRSGTRDLSTVYAALRVPLQRYLRRRVRDAEAADDLLHEVFLRVHDRVGTLREPECLEAWIYKIARNAIVDRKRRERTVMGMGVEFPAPDGSDDNQALRELAAVVHRCLEYLPEQDREALRATAFENTSHKELAARWGVTLSCAKSRVQRARRKLAQLYRECCDLEFDARGGVIGYTPRHRCCIRDADCRPRR